MSASVRGPRVAQGKEVEMNEKDQLFGLAAAVLAASLAAC
jgi:hypothetical protein